MRGYVKTSILLLVITRVESSIDGETYMDPLDIRKLKDKILDGENPCNPLYWYPRQIPEYCNYKVTNKQEIKPPLPMPLPIPVPVPAPPMPVIPPIPLPIPLPVPLPPPMPPLMPPPLPVYPIPPNGVPFPLQNNMVPVPHSAFPSFVPYPLPNMPPYGGFPQAAMVPGLPGMVSEDGGINVLPFSDVYSDMLEKHENIMIRRKLAKIIHDHGDFPNRKSYRRLKMFRKQLM